MANLALPMAYNDTDESTIDRISAMIAGLCTVELRPKERPSLFEIFGPPLILCGILVFGLLTQYVVELIREKRRKHSAAYLSKNNIAKVTHGLNCTVTVEDLMNKLLEGDGNFLSDFDREVIVEMRKSINDFRRLIIIALPAAASLLLTGTAIISQGIILRCLWPKVGRPEINTAISCFLAPAGLVYALSFGFMFQNAIQKQSNAMNKVTTEFSLLDQIITMTVKLGLPTKRHVMAMCQAVKAEMISMAMLVQKRKPGSFKHPHTDNVKVQIWSAIDILRDGMTSNCQSVNVRSILSNKTIDYIIELNNICTDRMGQIHTTIHPVKWAFLEILGVMTLYGVMLVDAQSFMFETTICSLTLYSISMLCYVLADLDSPFYGFFRVDMSVLYEVVKRAENVYNCARDERPIDISYVRV